MTTVELGKVIVERGVKLNELEESPFDNPIGEGSGGGVLFGTTGGVMEAALRTVYEVVSEGSLLKLLLVENVSGTIWHSKLGLQGCTLCEVVSAGCCCVCLAGMGLRDMEA
jgi:iron only hydrogenase large subunit-like protein